MAEERDRRVPEEPLTTAQLAGAAMERPGEHADGAAQGVAALFPDAEARELKERWHQVQASFVDEPRQAVELADQLVASAMKRLAESFADERSRLEAQWTRGDEVSTEDLRIALQRYRSFFGRLLSI